jgi:AraC family transcriptional regulator
MYQRAISTDEFAHQRHAHVVDIEALLSKPDMDQLVNDAREALGTDLVAARHYLDRLSLALKAQPLNSGLDRSTRSPQTPTNLSIKGGLAPWQIRKIETYIDDNLGIPIAVSTLSEISRVSKGHFCRAFKISTGDTPHGYIQRKRIERAQKMMRHTIEPLSQIAGVCGLADQSHLTRLFRKFVGMTPLTWRRAVQPAA